MLLRFLRQRLAAQPQFSIRRAVYWIGRFYRIVALISLDIAVVFALARGIGIPTPSPWRWLVNAAITYVVARALLRVALGKAAKTTQPTSSPKGAPHAAPTT